MEAPVPDRTPTRSSPTSVRGSEPLPSAGGDPYVQALARRVENLERQRLDELERENRLLRVQLENTEGRAGRTAEADRSAHGIGAVATELRSPAYLTAGLLEVERRCHEVEFHALQEDWSEARRAKLAAASAACRTLKRVCEDQDFETDVKKMFDHMREHQSRIATVVGPSVPANAADEYGWDDFKAQETALLQLLGLSSSLASDHIERAREAYLAPPVVPRATEPYELIGAIQQVRDAACMSADLLALGVQSGRSRRRWRTILLNGVSGTLIVGANAAAEGLLGSSGIAVSGALGSAAVGVAASAANG